uniref:C2H2-type domain-containing protein n=1 Tax=Macrostomum lignano TaxID=282301 RepID=A0A1I8JRI5_9PLAT
PRLQRAHKKTNSLHVHPPSLRSLVPRLLRQADPLFAKEIQEEIRERPGEPTGLQKKGRKSSGQSGSEHGLQADSVFPNADSIKSEVKCSACGCVLESPVCLPCAPVSTWSAAPACSENPPAGRNCSAVRVVKIESCWIILEKNSSLEQLLNGKGVPNWIRVELASLRLSCPKRCGLDWPATVRAWPPFWRNCGKTRGRLRPMPAAPRVECRVCKKQMLNKDLMAHHVKARCHDLELKLARKQCMKQCNKDGRAGATTVTMQEFRRTELCHLERMGVQGFARRQPLPHLTAIASLNSCDAMKRCERCRRVFNCDSNHETACRWHGGEIFIAMF